MKQFVLAVLATGLSMAAAAQEDSTKARPDSLKVGGMIIVKQEGKSDNNDEERERNLPRFLRKRQSSNISTNWLIFDIGFANLNDQTNYASPGAAAFAPNLGKDAFKLRTGKSINVNIWIFMQKVNLVKHVVNLKYGLGLELNNYRFEDTRLQLNVRPTSVALNQDSANLNKNKLAVDYLTIPVMLNFNLTPGRYRGFGFSAGMSVGYRYSSRQKIKDAEGNKTKIYNDFDLNQWKLAYIGELNLGPVKLYGSYAVKGMWSKGLDQIPYNFGVRLSHW
jgi:hypothetical protein